MKSSVLLGCMVLVGVLSCHRDGRFTRTPEADYLEVRKEYTVLLPRPSFMESAFGPDWQSQSLFYSPPMFSPECQQLMGQPGPKKPLSKLEPVFLLPCTDWPEASTHVYSLEKRQFVRLRIDLHAHTIKADAPVTPLYGEPRLLPDGSLVTN